MEATNDILKEAIYNHILQQREPITASEVACAMHITTQKASALLSALYYENRITWIPYRGRKGYGIDKVVIKKTYDCVSNDTDTSIKIDWEIITNSDIEFETEKTINYKNKIFKLIYKILLDYFDLSDII